MQGRGRELARVHLEHGRGVGEEAGVGAKRVHLQGRRHDDQLERPSRRRAGRRQLATCRLLTRVRPTEQHHPREQPEQQVRVHPPLVRLVQDETRVAREQQVALQLAQEHTWWEGPRAVVSTCMQGRSAARAGAHRPS